MTFNFLVQTVDLRESVNLFAIDIVQSFYLYKVFTVEHTSNLSFFCNFTETDL